MLNYMYNRLPKVYREQDVDKDLYKYLDVLGNGLDLLLLGSKEDFNLFEVKDVSIAKNICESLGIPYYPNIPLKYYQRLLREAEELNRVRGTLKGIKYLCRVLTQMEIKHEYTPYTLKVILQALTLEQSQTIDLDIKVVETLIKDFVPFYIDSIILAFEIGNQLIELKLYKGVVMTSTKRYNIITGGA